VGTGVAVGRGVGVKGGRVRVGVRVGVGVSVGVGVKVAVGEGVRVGVEVAVAVGRGVRVGGKVAVGGTGAPKGAPPHAAKSRLSRTMAMRPRPRALTERAVVLIRILASIVCAGLLGNRRDPQPIAGSMIGGRGQGGLQGL